MIFKILLFCTYIFLCHGYLPHDNHNSNPIVSTPSGRIRGTILKSRLGRNIFSFRGIRYAKPPVGELRFQRPVPADPWEGVYNATEDGPMCPQPKIAGIIAEDCLVANVYTTKLPNLKENPKRPVIVYIHPGAYFVFGSASNWVGPQYYMDQDIVLVTFNYRLATLGFLSTGDSLAPGNNGLKDQVLLLKWVKTHIASFGGDPDSVTLAGYSAGSTSIVLHMVSPMSQGLFHRGISMSGGGVNLPTPKHQLDVAKKQARIVGCPDDTSENIFKCLKEVPAQTLGDSLFEFLEFGSILGVVWTPVIDGEFLTDEFATLIKQGRFYKVPLMMGFDEKEVGNWAFMVVENQNLTDELNRDFEGVAPLAFLYETNTEHSREVSRAIKKFYFDDKPIDKSQLDDLSKAYADAIVNYGVHRNSKLLSQYSPKPLYRYYFTFQGRWSHFYLPGTTNKTWGVVHHDDLIYLFYIKDGGFPLFEKDSPKPEIDMVEKLTTLHYNFAKTGKPIPERSQKFDNVDWVPFDSKCEKYLEIGKKLVVKEKLFEERMAFWEKFYPF